MPSHTCHENVGVLMGIDVAALRDANVLIDFSDRWLEEHGLENI